MSLWQLIGSIQQTLVTDINMEFIQKLDTDTYNNLFVTSDTHFNHNKEFLYGKRGYDCPRRMTDDMIDIINSTVGENGILLHLGDFCLNSTQDDVKYIMSKLRIKALWLLWGNHNNPIQRSYGGTVQQVCAWNSNMFIRYLGHYFTFRHGSKGFVCFHFPISIWDGMSHGTMHLCGHSHGHHQISRPEDKTYKILDCGWDIHNKPLSFKEVEAIMNKKNINNLHHA
jgi:calcineurin-like phosphoesterase family protein